MRAALHVPLPAIILTGDVSADAATAIAGADCLRLDKPVRPEELLAAIASLRPPAVPVAGLAPPAPPQSPFRLTYVIDDEAQARLSLCELLAAQGLEVEGFASAEDFLAAYRPGAAGCLLIDAHLPGISGVDLLTTLRVRGDRLPVIVITGDGDIDLAVQAMRAGATEFIQKPVGGDALLASIARASQLSADLGADAAARADAVARVGGLTRRQAEVMIMVLAGAPSKNIAADLGISQRTVETHRAEIMHRMGTRSIPELARKAVLAAI
jgi:two-component system CheB/CheR fusion protein